ncbi:hypothetical protein HGRIS_010330 [Hohenbuehelia grisea]|uniref:Ribosomal RNA-processing protein 43 n=1 Tax=Hohenbuehelia grisea TaxID=104357 RepID=A0ABR3J406_9AGAR
MANTEQDDLKAAIFQRLHPRVYFERFLSEKIRPDGRDFGGWRDVSINVGSISTADGSALVRLGNTTVVCGVKAEIAEPDLDRAEEGFIVPNLDLPAICSPKFKPGPPTEEAQVLSDRLNDIIASSGMLPLSSLCIHPGRAAWVLYVDATCINYDGNAFDAALIAMVAALKNTRLPAPTYDETSGRTTCSRKTTVPLQLTRIPLSMSFGVFDATRIIADPTAFEEPLLDATLSVVIDENGEIVHAMQLGFGDAAGLDDASGATGGDTLITCISAAKTRRGQLSIQI